jgi:hypothetical protein
VTHLDIDDARIDQALAAIGDVVAQARAVRATETKSAKAC